MITRTAGKLLAGTLVFLFLSTTASPVFAKEIKIVFTGQSFACLYPCNCPAEPDGGVARRATFIKDIRSKTDSVIVVETGLSFASGGQDQYSQNYEMDKRRTDIYLKSLKEMNYDALLMSSQECIFGVDFLKRYKDLPFVSSNIKGLTSPYVIKDLGWIKVGILGLTDGGAVSKGLEGWQVPLLVLEERISDLKKKGANLIILLSSLAPQQDQELLKKIKGIDVVINGSLSLGSVNIREVEGVVYLTTWWQSKKVGVLSLELSNSKIEKKSLDFFRMSNEIQDDKAVSSIVPACFQNMDCKDVAALVSKCEGGSTPDARCIYMEPREVNMTVIVPRSCSTCSPQKVIANLRQKLKNLKIRDLFEDDAAAQKMIKEYNITMLPAYFFDKDVEESQVFPVLVPLLDEQKDFYVLKPSVAGVSYLVGRKRIRQRLDLFFDFTYSQLPELFSMLKAFQAAGKDMDIHINFLAITDDDGKFISKGGLWELEEFQRIACIENLYPKALFDYLICRSAQKGSTWWDECLLRSKIEPQALKECVLSEKGKALVTEHIKLTEELQIASGPTFVIENKEIFAIVNVPSIEEIEKIMFKGDKEIENEREQDKEKE